MTILEFLRRVYNMSQKGFAERIGINAASYSQLENRHRKAWPNEKRKIIIAVNIKESILFTPDDFAREISVKNALEFLRNLEVKYDE